jgi:hypothetical protein
MSSAEVASNREMVGGAEGGKGDKGDKRKSLCKKRTMKV